METDQETWFDYYLIQYVRDPDRGEAVNVGIILKDGDELTYRFLACDGDKVRRGRIPKKILRSNYVAWVAYFVRKIGEGKWNDAVLHTQRRAGGNYLAQFGGSIVRGNWTIDSLFDRLVA